MFKIDFDLPLTEAVELIPLADTHVGNPLCNIQALHDTISYISKEPDDPKWARICLLNGDLTESVTRHSLGNVFDMDMSPSVQVATVINMLKPLTEKSDKYPRGKILSYCGGNHDTDRYKETGITASESIACGLEIEDRYSPSGCYTFLRMKRINDNNKRVLYTIYNQHMTGSAGTVGGKANRLEKMSGVFADLYVGSHLHMPMTYKEDVIHPSNQTLVQKTMTFVLTNAFLRYGDYSQKMGMKPATIKVPRILIYQRRVNNDGRSIETDVIL